MVLYFAPTVHFTEPITIRCQPIIFIHSDQVRLHFYNSRQCQLPISWVTIVTCGPIVLPNVLLIKHFQIIFYFNASDIVQIFISMLMVMNLYKTAIAYGFHKWCFFPTDY